jgi:hypothetical protein
VLIDRNLFQRLVDRWNVLEIEHRGFRAMLELVKQQNPANAAGLDAVYQMATDSLRNDPVEIDAESQMADAWAFEDEKTFLRELDRLLTHRQNAQ